jgi:hypothetical protein
MYLFPLATLSDQNNFERIVLAPISLLYMYVSFEIFILYIFSYRGVDYAMKSTVNKLKKWFVSQKKVRNHAPGIYFNIHIYFW